MRLFFTFGVGHQRVATLDHPLVDLIEQLGGQQADVVFEGLVVVEDIFKGTVAEHLPDRVVVVDQLMQAVVVDIEVQADDAAHQNTPQGHAGAAIGFIDARGNALVEQVKDCSAQVRLHVEVLQAAQEFGDVVAGFWIEGDLGDIDFADGHLLALYDAHGGVFPGSINHIFWLPHYGLRVVMDERKSRNVAVLFASETS